MSGSHHPHDHRGSDLHRPDDHDHRGHPADSHRDPPEGAGHLDAHHQGRLGDRRRMLIALALTATLFVVEVAGGVLSHSLALLSDAGHMLSDFGAQGLSLVALVIAARPSDRRRTYGYYRIEILAALANGVALFALSGWIVWSAWHRLRGVPQPIETGLMMAVAFVGLCANLAGAWLLHGAESLNVKGAYLHVLQDTLSSVAVLIGGAAMMLFASVRGIYLIDPLLSLGIGLFVNVGAWRLVRDAVDVLLEAVPLGIDLDAVSATIRAEPLILAVHDLHLWTITSGIYALSAHVVVDGLDRSGEAGDGGHDALLGRMKEALLRLYRISHITIQVETSAWQHRCFNCETSATEPQVEG